jgi:hypothetical protein
MEQDHDHEHEADDRGDRGRLGDSLNLGVMSFEPITTSLSERPGRVLNPTTTPATSIN